MSTSKIQEELFNSIIDYANNPSEARKQVINDAIFNFGEKGRNQRIKEFWAELKKIQVVMEGIVNHSQSVDTLRADFDERFLEMQRLIEEGQRMGLFFKKMALIGLGSLLAISILSALKYLYS